jgi:hypothetical protein
MSAIVCRYILARVGLKLRLFAQTAISVSFNAKFRLVEGPPGQISPRSNDSVAANRDPNLGYSFVLTEVLSPTSVTARQSTG